MDLACAPQGLRAGFRELQVAYGLAEKPDEADETDEPDTGVTA